MIADSPLGQLLAAIRSQNLITILAVTVGFLMIVLAIAFHEAAHAYTAYQLGDMTPRYQGRLTLNPLAHLDPVGTLLILVAGFGWGRPVMFNPFNLRMDRRMGSALVAFAGPLTNIILGVVFGLSLRFLLLTVDFTGSNVLVRFIAEVLALFVNLNFVLAFFNLIPIPPLDGSKVLLALLPPDLAYSLERFYIQLGPYSLLLFFGLIYFGGRFLGPLIYGPVGALYSLVVGQPF